MKKLNNKGYMLVEILIAIVLALSIAYFLIDITIKMVNKNNDYYIDSLLTADKNVITKEIMDDVNDKNLKLAGVKQETDKIIFSFETNSSQKIDKSLEYDKDNKTIKYGDYTRKLSNDLLVNDIFNISAECSDGSKLVDGKCETTGGNASIILEMPAHTNFNSNDYGIKLNIPYNTEDEIDIEIPNPIPTSGKCGANVPSLTDGLIPVYYDYSQAKWLKANITNEGDHWYNYCDSKWANAVLVSQTNRNTYVNASKGTVINEDDILAYYVWIPRYKYKVWNINKQIGVKYYDVETNGVDIVFENNTETTGTISCTYSFSKNATNTVRNETCSGSNGQYYTHPAFTVGSTQIKGFWMGKFELSGEVVDEKIQSIAIKPNALSLGENEYYTEISKKYNSIIDMQKSGNAFGLSTNTNQVESHMINNMEWGAVTYLTYSTYGRCDSNSCTEVAFNNSLNNQKGTSTTGRSSGLPAGQVDYQSNGKYAYNEIVKNLDLSSGTSVSFMIKENEDNWTYDSSTKTYTSYNTEDNKAETQMVIEFKVTQNGYLSFDYSNNASSILNKVNYSMTKDGEEYTVSGSENTNSTVDFGKLLVSTIPSQYNNLWIKVTPGTYTIKFYYKGIINGTTIGSVYTNRLYIKNITIKQGSNAKLLPNYVGEAASTTNNIYGVYDMSGGFAEWIWCNISSVKGSFKYTTVNGWNDNEGNDLSSEEAAFYAKYDKYLTKYAYGTTENDQTAYNRTRLGDALGEITFHDREFDFGFTDTNGNTTYYYTGNLSWFGDDVRVPYSYNLEGAYDPATLIRGYTGKDDEEVPWTGIATALSFRDHANSWYATTRAVLTVY